MAKRLIIQADDLGLCGSVNRAIFELFEKGCISSASVMAVGARFDAVAEYALGHPESDMGAHLTILSDSKKLRYRPLSPPSRIRSLLDREGYLLGDRELLASRAEPEHVVRECRLQISKMIDAGIRLSHLDGHRDAFSIRNDLSRVARILSLEHELEFRPSSSGARFFSRTPETCSDEVAASYLGFLDRIKTGVSLLVVHPGRDGRELRAAFGKDVAWGSLWRQRDYDVLMSRPFRKRLKERGIKVVSFAGKGRPLGV